MCVVGVWCGCFVGGGIWTHTHTPNHPDAPTYTHTPQPHHTRVCESFEGLVTCCREGLLTRCSAAGGLDAQGGEGGRRAVLNVPLREVLLSRDTRRAVGSWSH